MHLWTNRRNNEPTDGQLIALKTWYHFKLLMVPYHEAKSLEKLSRKSVNVLLGSFTPNIVVNRLFTQSGFSWQYNTSLFSAGGTQTLTHMKQLLCFMTSTFIDNQKKWCTKVEASPRNVLIHTVFRELCELNQVVVLACKPCNYFRVLSLLLVAEEPQLALKKADTKKSLR